MLNMLISAVLCLAAVSATFSLLVAVTALLRKAVLVGRERMLCRVWTAVLIITLIPLNFGLFMPDGGKITSVVLGWLNDITYDSYDIGANSDENGKPSDTLGDVAVNGSVELTAVKKTPPVARINYNVYIAGTLLFIWFTVAVIRFILPLRDYMAGRKRLELYSRQMENSDTQRIFDECRTALGIKHDIGLMEITVGKSCSPCECGILHPKVYIDTATAEMPEEKLRYIFIHELSHIQLSHMQLKLLMLAVSAVHWFNPVASKCAGMVSEDCELACDRSVMTKFGGESSDSYMYTILEIARRTCAVRAYVGVNTLGGGLFLSESNYQNDKNSIMKRYSNMKNNTTRKYAAVVTVAALAICILIGASAITSCGLPLSVNAATDDAASYTTGSALVDEGIRAYLGLNSDEMFTLEMLAEIESIELRASTVLTNSKEYSPEYYIEFFDRLKAENQNGVFVEYIINGQAIDLLETRPTKLRFEGTILPAIEKFSQSNSNSGLSIALKWKAFYSLKDITDPRLDDEGRAEMLACFPETADCAYYYFDPYTSPRECAVLLSFAYSAGLLDNRYLPDGKFDAHALSTLPNLKSAVFTGVEPYNFDDTFTIKTEAETCGNVITEG